MWDNFNGIMLEAIKRFFPGLDFQKVLRSSSDFRKKLLEFVVKMS